MPSPLSWLSRSVFPTLALVGLGAALYAAGAKGLGPGQRQLALAVAVVASLVVVVVLVRMATQDGIRDWFSGGVVSISRDDAVQLMWEDWAIVMTRRGALHRKARRLRLERRLLCGLLPWDSIERSLDATARARSEHREVLQFHRRTSRYGSSVLDSEVVGTRSHYDHVVELMQTGHDPLVLLDVASGHDGDRAAQLADSVEMSVNQALDAMVETPRVVARRA